MKSSMRIALPLEITEELTEFPARLPPMLIAPTCHWINRDDPSRGISLGPCLRVAAFHHLRDDSSPHALVAGVPAASRHSQGKPTFPETMVTPCLIFTTNHMLDLSPSATCLLKYPRLWSPRTSLSTPEIVSQALCCLPSYDV